MYIRSIATVLAASLMAGCAIHPVPEDVTGLRTEDIVKQIRCETRDAARTVIKKILSGMATDGNSLIARDLLAEFEANPESMTTFDWRRSFPDAAHIQV